MDSRTGLLVIFGLYLAAGVHSVKYEGPKVLMSGQPWNITCYDLPSQAILSWKRDGQSFDEDLASGVVTVKTHFDEKMNVVNSTLTGFRAVEGYGGAYTCVDGFEAHNLQVFVEKYTSPKMVMIGQPWSMTCSNLLPGLVISWKRNGQNLCEDLSNGIMSVQTNFDENMNVINSTLTALRAAWSHEGRYTCFDEYYWRNGHNIRVIGSYSKI